MSQQQAVQLVLEERAYQDKKWGGAVNDASQSREDWIKYITEYAQGTGRAEHYDFATRMKKVSALALAALEVELRNP